MIHIDCKNCNFNCCQNPRLTPVLLPSEEKRFKRYSKKVKTPFRDMFVIKKKKNNKCIFLNNKTIRCSIHSKRPLECRLYPFLLDFKKGFKLDKRFCPHLKTLTFNKKEISALIKKEKFPKNWMKAYSTLTEY